MTLVFKPEPKGVADAVKSGLNKMHAMRAFGTPRLARIISERTERDAPQSAPMPSQALPVYTLGLNDLAEGKDFAAAHQTGWRYLLKHGNDVVASADAVIDPRGEAIFAQVSEGPLVTGLNSAIQAANSKESLVKGEYEVRLLMVPALYVAALWFVDKAEGQDLAMPIDPVPVPSTLIPNKVITGKEMLSLLHEAALELQSAQPSEKEGP